jgi:hypothetical protein
MQVTSHAIHEKTTPADKTKVRGHMAFNYWFHPPDRFDAGASPESGTPFSKPYTSPFWPRDWRAREDAQPDDELDDAVREFCEGTGK